MSLSLVFLIGCLGVQVWAWRRIVVRLRRGTMTRLQAAARYAGWAFLPVLAFVGGVAGMVGIEELLRVAIVHERVALLAIPVLAMSVLGTALFAIRCAFVRPRRSVP